MRAKGGSRLAASCSHSLLTRRGKTVYLVTLRLLARQALPWHLCQAQKVLQILTYPQMIFVSCTAYDARSMDTRTEEPNVPPRVAGHPVIPDTFTWIHSQSSIHAHFHPKHSSYRSLVLCLYREPRSKCLSACGVLPAVNLVLPSADAPASVASHKRLVAHVVSGVSSLDAPIKEDQATVDFSRWGRFKVGRACNEVPDWSFCATGLGAS